MTSYRHYLKSHWVPGMDDDETDQMKGLPAPPIQKPYPDDAQLVDLVPAADFTVGQMPIIEAINNRRSRRVYTGEPLSLEELSYLLWATQGVQDFALKGQRTLRTAPSGGAMHPFETYLLVNRVEGLEPGLYRYLAVEHKLLPLAPADADAPAKIGEISMRQPFVGKGAVVFIWTVRPYRTEWRYGEDSLKDILMSAGHICQNLYLACESLGAGTCAVAAYQQKPLDTFVGVDGEDEIALYLASVGKV